jgi:hypothetical protein
MTCVELLSNRTFHICKFIFWSTAGLGIAIIWPQSLAVIMAYSWYANWESSLTSLLASGKKKEK